MLSDQIEIAAIVKDIVFLSTKGVLVGIKESSSVYTLLDVVLCIVLKYNFL
jgi:hypothetical protein